MAECRQVFKPSASPDLPLCQEELDYIQSRQAIAAANRQQIEPLGSNDAAHSANESAVQRAGSVQPVASAGFWAPYPFASHSVAEQIRQRDDERYYDGWYAAEERRYEGEVSNRDFHFSLPSAQLHRASAPNNIGSERQDSNGWGTIVRRTQEYADGFPTFGSGGWRRSVRFGAPAAFGHPGATEEASLHNRDAYRSESHGRGSGEGAARGSGGGNRPPSPNRPMPGRDVQGTGFDAGAGGGRRPLGGGHRQAHGGPH